MNIGIIFDSREYSQVSANTEICRKALYEYSFETLYRHPLIDAVYMMFEDTTAARGYRWLKADIDKDLGTDKHAEVMWGNIQLTDVIHYAGNMNKEDIDCFVIQDIRYPLITDNQVESVIRQAVPGTAAVTTSQLENNFMTADGKGVIDIDKYRVIRCPIAIGKDSDLLKNMPDGLYRAAATNDNTILCESADARESLINEDDVFLYEAVIKARKGNSNEFSKEKDAS